MSEDIVRRATLADVEAMHHLINHFAGKGLMLPASRNKLYQNIRDFFVAEKGGQFAGCCALHVLWSDLGEIRSLAVKEVFQKNGVGRCLARAALRDAAAPLPDPIPYDLSLLKDYESDYISEERWCW